MAEIAPIEMMLSRHIALALAAFALVVASCDIGTEVVAATDPPTTTSGPQPVQHAARARDVICEPLLEFFELNPIVGFPERVEQAVTEARGLLNRMASVAPQGIAQDYAAWIAVRRGALDAIEEAGFITVNLAAEDPRFQAVGSEEIREMESMLRTYCTGEVIYGSHPWFDDVERSLVPRLPILESRSEQSLVLRSHAEHPDLLAQYETVFGPGVETDNGIEWRSTYAGVPYDIVVRDEGLGSRVTITWGDAAGA